MWRSWRTPLLRLYIVLAVPWCAWFGYWAVEAHQIYAFNRDYVDAIDRASGADRRGYMESAVLRDRFLKVRDSNLIWLAIVPLGYPFASLAFLWVIAGWRTERETA